MTKNDIINAVWERVGGERQKAKTAFLFTIWLMQRALAGGDNVSIRGFGVIESRWLGERLGRNPETGLAQVWKGKRVARFRSSPALRRSINRGEGQ